MFALWKHGKPHYLIRFLVSYTYHKCHFEKKNILTNAGHHYQYSITASNTGLLLQYNMEGFLVDLFCQYHCYNTLHSPNKTFYRRNLDSLTELI